MDAALKRAAARLGIKISHSAPGRPQGRGKIERFFGLVRQEFLVEIGDGSSITDLAQLNKLLDVVSAVDVFGCHDVAIA